MEERQAGEIALKISGMTCSSCVSNIGVRARPNSSFGDGHVKIFSMVQIQKVNECDEQQLFFSLTSYWKRHRPLAERNVLKLRGVESVSVSLATNTGKFAFDPDVIGARDIMALIDNLGVL
jgi:copper chaperone CopZ